MNLSLNADERPSASYILDASALLALLLGEPGAERIRDALARGAVIGSVNLTEVITRLVDENYPDEAIDASIDGLVLQVVNFETEAAKFAGLLRRTTRSLGLSLGDRSCLALAAELKLPALTADRRWAELNLGIEVELIR